MTATERTPQDAAPEAAADTALRVELTVAGAAAAARAGDLDAALKQLTRTDDPAVTGHREVVDLRARIHAQRRELDEAEACWRRLLDDHPGDESATAGLERIRRHRRTGPVAAFGRTRHLVLPAAAVVLCAGAVTAAAWVLPGGSTDDAVASSDVSASVADAERNAEREARQKLTAEQEREAADAEARRDEVLRALQDELRAPGVEVLRHEDSVEVVFDQGLFSEGAQLTDAGTAQLTRLGSLLDRPEDMRMEVLGHIANVREAPASGGSATSMWRAMVAARVLSDASGRPLTAFDMASGEQRDAPHETDAQNRTVTVILTPHTDS